MLPVLSEAGVVDAGAAGLVEIVRGLAAALTGEPLPAPPPSATRQRGEDAVHQELSQYRYCTVFIVEGEGLDAAALEAELAPLGDSLLVVGDSTALKVHVHTDDPGRALSLGVARGVVEGVEIANMHAQTREREQRLLHAVPRTGRARVRRDRGRGRGRQPPALREPGRARRRRRSHDEPVDGRAARGGRGRPGARGGDPAERPQRPARRRACRRATPRSRCASSRASRCRRVWPRWSPSTPICRRTRTRTRWPRRPTAVATGAVTIASRDVTTNGLAVTKGAWLGLADGLPVAGGESFEDVARAVLDRLLAEPRSVLTLLTGEDPPALDAVLDASWSAASRPRARGARGRSAALRAADLRRVAPPSRVRRRVPRRRPVVVLPRPCPHVPPRGPEPPAFTLASNLSQSVPAL